MEYRPLEVTLISAKDIKDVNLIGKMDVYVVVYLSNDPGKKQKTPIDKDGGTSPKWNSIMKFNVDDSAAQKGGLVLIFQLRADRSVGSDKDIGEVHVPIKELLDNEGDGKSAQFISYQVRTSSGKAKGQLNFSYKFGEKNSTPVPTVAKGGDEPVTAYPPAVAAAAAGTGVAYPPPGSGSGHTPRASSSGYPPPGAGAGAYGYPPPPAKGGAYPYPPPQTAAGYGYPPPPQGAYQYPPPPPGYGYPPPQQGYGYPPMMQQQQQQQAPKKKKNKFGMGMGAGLLGGALGGLLIGDMVSDAAYENSYDAGFDDGFDDSGGGFDF